MLEQTQFPFSSNPHAGTIENSSVDMKSSNLTSAIVFIVLAASIIGGMYYLNLKSDGFQKDKPKQ
jgi:hypothetical protein